MASTTPVPAEIKAPAAEAGECSKTAEAETPAPLPPLSPKEFREYNHLADMMDAYHNHFRRTWTMLYNACDTGRRPQGMSLRKFIDEGLYFARGLTMHHNIEESYFFPMLARRMPEFQSGKGKKGGGAAELLQQHRQIHAGMDGFEEYLTKCRRGETELELGVLKAKMDSWGGVLWTHLDQEVKTLGAENMRKYWTKEEIIALHP